ncbi:unnamed protein product [Chrysoparadoxa australica]
MARDRMVGGVLGNFIGQDPFFSTWRELSVLKNDVWASDDLGESWFLLAAGCKDPQEDLVRLANEREGAAGSPQAVCSVDRDCYGSAVCKVISGNSEGTCVCPMWSPREMHKVVLYNDNLYLTGGLAASRRGSCGKYACGDLHAGSHRRYMNDVWHSTDGATWVPLTLNAEWAPRADHALVAFYNTLYVMGGATASETGRHEVAYLNDVWAAPLPTQDSLAARPAVWQNNGTAAWDARAGMSALMEPSAAVNSFQPRIYLIGGHNEEGILADSWSWGPGNATGTLKPGDSFGWAQDYSDQQPYRSAIIPEKFGGRTGFIPGPPPQGFYVDGDSPIELLVRYKYPTLAPPERGSQPVERRLYAEERNMEEMRAVGIR